MSKGRIAAACAAAVSCAGLGALASTGIGDDPATAPAVGGHYRIAEPALEESDGRSAARAQTLARRRGRRSPT